MKQTFDSQALALIEEHVLRFMRSMGFEKATIHCQIDEEVPQQEEGCLTTCLLVGIEAGDDGKLLIGTQGCHLSALQHLVRSLLRRQLAEHVYVNVDVNGYRARRERSLVSLAETAARRATMQGRTVVLRPMEASDRRMIHTALASRSDVRTESMGDEPNRRVIIRPIFL